MTHELKCWPRYFVDIFNRVKTFELRKADRAYRVGDVLYLREWNPSDGEYTGRWTYRRVTHIIANDPVLGLEAGWVVMSIGTEEVKPDGEPCV